VKQFIYNTGFLLREIEKKKLFPSAAERGTRSSHGKINQNIDGKEIFI